MSQPITTRIPAAPEHVHVLRTVVAAVASRAGGSVDDLADLRLVVDEAATLLLRKGGGANVLAMTIEPEGQGLQIKLTVDSPGADPPAPDGLSWQVLRGLADEVEALGSADGPAIRIRRRLGAG